jgi:hypothetical protein
LGAILSDPASAFIIILYSGGVRIVHGPKFVVGFGRAVLGPGINFTISHTAASLCKISISERQLPVME